MQAGYLVLLLIAMLATRHSAAEPPSMFRAPTDFDSYDDMDSEEEPSKRAAESWKVPMEHEKKFVEEDFKVLEVPVKEEKLVKVPVPVEMPSPLCPYSVELKLSVPTPKKHVKTHIETVPVQHAKKAEFSCPPCGEKHPFHFSHPYKMDFIESAPLKTEFSGFKSPYKGHLFEEEMYVPEFKHYGKFHPYPYFPKSHPTKVIVVEEEEHAYKPQPSHFYYPKHVPTYVEEPITYYQPQKLFKSQPIYHSQPIIIEEPIIVDKHHKYHHHHHYKGKKHHESFEFKDD